MGAPRIEPPFVLALRRVETSLRDPMKREPHWLAHDRPGSHDFTRGMDVKTRLWSGSTPAAASGSSPPP